MKSRWRLLVPFLFVAAVSLAGQRRLSLDVRMVEVVATVTDASGRYVPNLAVQDFVLKEDGVAQTVSHIEQAHDLPVSMGILLDTSGSMSRKMTTASDAIKRFVERVHKDDDIFLMTFAEAPVIAQDFTSDRNKLSAALTKIRLGQKTALYDAVDEGLQHLRLGIYTKRALLVVTDGQETGASGDTFREALQTVRHENALVYCLGIAPDTRPVARERPQPLPSIVQPELPRSRGGRGLPGRRLIAAGPASIQSGEDTVDMTTLQAFADASGGRAWLVGSDRVNLDRILDIIVDDLRNQYTLGYYPEREEGEERLRHIELTVRNPKLQVRARTDYIGR